MHQVGARMINGDPAVIRRPQHLEFRAQVAGLCDGSINIGQQFAQTNQCRIVADRVAVKHSSRWHSASIPVEEAMCAGMLVVSSGSRAT